MNEQIIKPAEQAEAIRLAKVATGPSIGETPFWQQVVQNLNAIDKEDALVQPRANRD